MSIAGHLASLRSRDAAPTVNQLGGETLFLAALDDLPEHLVGRAAEAVWASWDLLVDRPTALAALLCRSSDVEDDVAFADISEAAVAAAWTEGSSSIDITASTLLAVLDEESIRARPLRAGHAVRHAANLASQDTTPVRAKLLARIADLGEVPVEAATSFVRAYGQLNDIEYTPWLDEKIAAMAQHADAAPQVALELALGDLRRAFLSDSEQDTLRHLRSAASKFRSSAATDEGRDDAVALEAVAECVLAFADRDAQRMAACAATGERAGRALAAGRWRDQPSAVERKIGGWVKLLAQLRELRAGLDSETVLYIDPVVRAIARAYGGLRAIDIQDAHFGLQAVVVPQCIAALAASDIKRTAVSELASETGSPEIAYNAAKLLKEAHAAPRSRGGAGSPPALPTQRQRPDFAPPDAERDILIDRLVGQAVAGVESYSLQQAFAQVTECLAQFVRRSIDRVPPYRRESGLGVNATERDLQDELFDFVKYTYPVGVAAYEPQKVGGGRADISLCLFDETIYIECKKEPVDASHQALEAAYAAQAGSYSAADHALGVVAVLDVTAPQTTSAPVFAEEMWVHQQAADHGGKTLLFVRVAGRRVTPSELSR